MIIVLRIANPYIILRQITNLPQLRTSASTGTPPITHSSNATVFANETFLLDALYAVVHLVGQALK